MTTGTDGMARRNGADRERIAQPQIEPARQAELLADADRQHAAVHEHRAAVPLGRLRTPPHSASIVDRHVVHRGKQTGRAQAELAERALETRLGVGAAGLNMNAPAMRSG